MTRISEERALWLANNVLPHEPALRAWLAHRRVLQLETDDIVQETYAVLAGLEDTGHIRDARSYMFSVAHSIILQSLRRLRIVSIESMAEIERLSILSEESSPEDQVAHTQELSRMAHLIATLPAKCREAFTLRKVHDLSQREVAQRMGVSENTVEKHIGKAIRILMDSLCEEPGRAKGSGSPGGRKDNARGKI